MSISSDVLLSSGGVPFPHRFRLSCLIECPPPPLPRCCIRMFVFSSTPSLPLLSSRRPRFFEVPAHPCLASRRLGDTPNEDASAAVASKTSSTIQLRNFAVDLTTVRLMMEALKRSSDVDTVNFHNAGLTGASIDVLVEGLEHTTVRCLGLDYNTPPAVLSSSSSPTRRPSASETTELAAAEAAATERSSLLTRNFAGLVGEGEDQRSRSHFCVRSSCREQLALRECALLATSLSASRILTNQALFCIYPWPGFRNIEILKRKPP